jgi:hydrogenase nickel incorporation protein HypB
MNRAHFATNKNYVVNFLSSPGAGKTSLIENIILLLKEQISIAVIEGDVQTDLDAKRINELGMPVVQIVTNGGCHLEANLIKDALKILDTKDVDVVIIENVGNLVCPAGYDLGEHNKIVILSITEGEEKPLKYPAVFRNAQILIINKIDLLPHLNCSIAEMKKNALAVNPDLIIFETSCVSGEGIDKFCDWFKSKSLNIKRPH